MEAQQFQALVARVERLAEADPKGYVRRVFAIAALGFVILGLVIAMAMVNVALIGGVVLLVVFSGGKALLFFAKLGKLVIVLAIPVWLMLRTTWTLVFARLPRPEGRRSGATRRRHCSPASTRCASGSAALACIACWSPTNSTPPSSSVRAWVSWAGRKIR